MVNEFVREQFYPLVNDPGLHAAGVKIGARVKSSPHHSPQLRIVFRAWNNEASVECVHIAVYAGPLDTLPPVDVMARSTERHPIKLPPEEHFFALNSYVAGIADVGLGTMFKMALEMGNIPVGFNSMMQQQVLYALNRLAPDALVDLLLRAGDDNPIVRKALVRFDQIPIPVLEVFAKDPDSKVRFAVARNESTPEKALTDLSKDENAKTRLEVAKHRNVSYEVLASLSTDGTATVRRVASRRLKSTTQILTRLANDNEVKVRREATLSIMTPPEVLAKLAGDEDVEILRRVARNERTPQKSLVLLAKNTDNRIRSLVAGNENTPPEVLAQLARDEDETVRRVAAENANASPEIRARLAEEDECTLMQLAEVFRFDKEEHIQSLNESNILANLTDEPTPLKDIITRMGIVRMEDAQILLQTLRQLYDSKIIRAIILDGKYWYSKA